MQHVYSKSLCHSEFPWIVPKDTINLSHGNHVVTDRAYAKWWSKWPASKFSACRLLIHNILHVWVIHFSATSVCLFFLVWQHKQVIFCFLYCCTHFLSTKQLSCCFSVRCTLGTGNNFKLKCCIERAFFPTNAGVLLVSFSLGFLQLLLPHGPNYLSERVQILIEGGYYFIQHRQLFGYYSTYGYYSRKYGIINQPLCAMWVVVLHSQTPPSTSYRKGFGQIVI